MSYLSFIIAALMYFGQSGTGDLTFMENLDRFLDVVVSVETTFMYISLVVAVIAIGILILLYFSSRDFRIEALGCFGTLLVVVVAWAILEVVTLIIAMGLASAIDPSGIIDTFKFVLCLILMMVLGAG